MPILNVGTYSDADSIVRGLWQGSAPPADGTLKKLGFDRVVLAAMEYQPEGRLFEGVRVQHCPLDDSLNLSREEASRAEQCAQSVARGIRRGENILVTCMAGRNRSGLVTALTLRELTGMTGAQAVAIVQSKRPNALTNPHFVTLLERLPSKQEAHPQIRRGPRHPNRDVLRMFQNRRSV
jgi:hypothetical protein